MGNSVERFQNSQWKKLERLNFSKATILTLLSGGNVLDIGCGDGLLLEHIQARGNDCVGVDISSEAVKICHGRGLHCYTADITEPLAFADNSFENVLLIDVLEHLFQPGDVLKEAVRVSSKYVYISVPNFVSLPARLQVLLGRVPENNTARDGHVYWMTWRVIKDLLAGSNLRIVETMPNTFWEQKPVIGPITRAFTKINPSLFALSFIIKAEKK